jgi:glucosamine-phosphate N-acetyltransferase|uniref:N-acetyltransferase domain-containing protein n=1 Tax=viral metagenome TaxID=1070528 RepID=A0A6C0IKB6_9ZZZZ
MEETHNQRFKIRQIKEPDYYGGYLNVLSDGFQLDPSSINVMDFQFFLSSQKGIIFVIEDTEKSLGYGYTNYIIASATVFVEQKLIHNMGKVGHIEDVVVSSDYRGHGLGKLIVNKCIDYAKSQRCYKCILDCAEENVEFYKKCNSDFQEKGIEMALYF